MKKGRLSQPAVINSRCHTQSGQEMDHIRLCDIGRRNIGPTVRSVDRILENSSEVGEKADYPVYQPCKKETDGVRVYSHWLLPLPFVLNSTSHHDYSSTHKKEISVRSFLSSLLTPSPHFRSYLTSPVCFIIASMLIQIYIYHVLVRSSCCPLTEAHSLTIILAVAII